MNAEKLRVTTGPAAGAEIPIGSEFLIGRSGTPEGKLGNDAELSRNHARISRVEANQIQLEDLGSSNGTYLNGRLLTQPRLLRPGDVVRVGVSELLVVGAEGEVFSPTVRTDRPPAPLPKAAPPVTAGAPEVAAPAAAPAAPAAAAPSNGIVVRGLVRQFSKGPRAVDGIDLEVSPGEIYGFLGPNGAGKSTTVHMLVTLLPPSAGTAVVAGHDIVKEGAKVRASIGVALQEAALDPVLSAKEHMSLQMALQGVPKNARAKRTEELIDRVGLSEFFDRKVGGYSGGMKRRLDLALALVHNPRVVFLDEPTTGLDPKSRNDLWEEVSRLTKEEGVTIFLTTQYLEEADLLADRIGIIDHGTIVAEGTPTSLKEEIGRPTVEALPEDDADRQAVREVLQQFGEPSGAGHRGEAVQLRRGVDDLAEIVRALDARGLKVASLNLHAPTLDDVFLAKTGRSLEESREQSERERGASQPAVSLPGQPIAELK